MRGDDLKFIHKSFNPNQLGEFVIMNPKSLLQKSKFFHPNTTSRVLLNELKCYYDNRICPH